MESQSFNRFTIIPYLERLLAAIGFIIVFGLLIYSPSLQGGDLISIQHESREGRVTSGLNGNNDVESRYLNRQLESAEITRNQMRFERDRAYIPSSPLEALTRQERILNAQSALDNADNAVNSIQNRIYLHKRMVESQMRDKRLQELKSK